jgi:hypothetical protein
VHACMFGESMLLADMIPACRWAGGRAGEGGAGGWVGACREAANDPLREASRNKAASGIKAPTATAHCYVLSPARLCPACPHVPPPPNPSTRNPRPKKPFHP